MALPSANQTNFAKIERQPPPRSRFDRSFTHKTTGNAGYLIPVFLQPTMPGDTWNVRAQIFIRALTLLHPIMDNMQLKMYWFYSPERILWDNFERFMGAQDTPSSSTDFEVPVVGGEEATNWDTCTLGDYFGIPTQVNWGAGGSSPISAIPFRMYHRVYNDWFRDQDLQAKLYCPTGDGPDAWEEYNLLRGGKLHDYFTACRPWPQKGEAVVIPIADSAPVIGTGNATGFTDGGQPRWLAYTDNAGINGQLNIFSGSTAAVGTAVPGATAAPAGDFYLGLHTNPLYSNVIADLSAATPITINDLRFAIACQQVLELDARGGTRYVEQQMAVWGQDIEDYRVNRPEYLGGGSHPIRVQVVPQTSETNTTPQAELAAYAQGASQTGFVYTCKEFGYIMGILRITADLTYQQGLERFWTRSTRFDYPHPAFFHLGEQAVLNKEIFGTGNFVQDNEVFGYQERYADWRYGFNKVTGDFRSNAATSLESWHLALDFAELPLLNDGFIQDNPPVDRVIAVEAGPNTRQFKIDCFYGIDLARQLPVHATPGLTRL